MVMPGVTMRKASLKRRSWRLASLFSACQAMSMAMTIVLPRAGRHLEGDAVEPGLDGRSPRGERCSDQGLARPGRSSVR